MFPLSKIMTLGALLAGSSGISIYLIPYIFMKNGKGILKEVIKTSSSPYNSKNINSFDNKEREKLEQLNTFYKEMKKAKEDSRKLQKLKNDLMEKTFKNIFEVEKQLVTIYEKHKSILEKLQQNTDNVNKQQELSAKLQSEIQFLNHSLSLFIQMREMFWAQGEHLGKFICFIDKGGKQEQNCEQLEKNWISKMSQNVNSSSSEGGGSESSNSRTQGESARKTLAEVKADLVRKQEELKKYILGSATLETNLLTRGAALMEFWNNINYYIIFLSRLSSRLSFITKELNKESNLEIDKLNKYNKELMKIYQEIKELKNKIITFQHYEGKFQNLVCNNTQNKEKNMCDSLKK